MNTPAHLIFGLSAFGRANAAAVVAGALAGALIPDLSLYLMAGAHLFILGTPPDVVFGELYFSQSWQAVFRIDNSIPLWGIGLALGIWSRKAWVIAMCGAALLHLGLDLAFHHDDGRAHFWPFTTWRFQSPLSYWDSAHYGNIVGPLEIIVSLVLCWRVLWPRHPSVAMRSLIVVFALMEFAPAIIFAIMLAGQA